MPRDVNSHVCEQKIKRAIDPMSIDLTKITVLFDKDNIFYIYYLSSN